MSSKSAGIYAYCNQCQQFIGRFPDLGEFKTSIIDQKRCLNEKCNAIFTARWDNDDEFWNVEWRIIPSKEEFAIKLLEEIAKESQQYIFCYEDRGPNSTLYRYPDKKIKFYAYDTTNRASHAFAMNIFDKEGSYSMEKSYCFANPYALLQVAREALKGYYWLKYGK